MLRICKTCGEEKLHSDFPKKRDCRDGIKPNCKSCFNKSRPSRAGCEASKNQWQRWYQENKDVLLQRRKANPKIKEYAKHRYKEKSELIRAQQKEYKKQPNAKALHANREGKRRALKLKATPEWLSEDHKQEITNLYWLAQDLQVITGESYHVDHIVPLQGKKVCGLHVPWNLQVLPADINLSKSNKF